MFKKSKDNPTAKSRVARGKKQQEEVEQPIIQPPVEDNNFQAPSFGFDIPEVDDSYAKEDPSEKVESDEEGKKKPKKGLKVAASVLGVLLVGGGGVFFLNQSGDTAPTDTAPVEPAVTDATDAFPNITEEVVDPDAIDLVVGDDDTEDKDTPEGGNVIEDVPSANVNFESPTMVYANGHLRLVFSHPSSWYVTEQSHQGFDIIRDNTKDGKFDWEGAKLSGVIPVADFASPAEDQAYIQVLLYPSDSKEVTPNKVMKSISTVELNSLKEGKSESKKLDDKTATFLSFTYDDYGQASRGTQAVYKLDKGTLVFLLKAQDFTTYPDNLKILEDLVKSVEIK